MLILSPPAEVKRAVADQFKTFNPLDIDFLKEKGLENWLDMQASQMYEDKLRKNWLENSYLASLFDIFGNQLDEKLLEPVDPVLPDYRKSSGIVAYKDEMIVELCRDNGSDVQCVTTPRTQNSTIYQTQGTLEFKNRVNGGNNTIITLIQR